MSIPGPSGFLAAFTAGFFGWAIFWSEPPRPRTPRTVAPDRWRAYVVLKLDTRHQPPVVDRACVFSAPASGITMLGHEMLVDIHHYEADTLEEARRGALEQSQLYYPWLTPLLRKCGEVE